MELYIAARENDIAAVQRLLAAGADPNFTTWLVSWMFYMIALPGYENSHGTTVPLSCLPSVKRPEQKEGEKKSSSLAPTPHAACIIIRKKTWLYNIIKESKHLRHANVD